MVDDNSPSSIFASSNAVGTNSGGGVFDAKSHETKIGAPFQFMDKMLRALEGFMDLSQPFQNIQSPPGIVNSAQKIPGLISSGGKSK